MRVPCISVAAALCLLVSVGVRTASADPVNNPSATPVTLVCDNGQTVQAVIVHNPAHILTSTGNVIPIALTFTDLTTGASQTTTIGNGLRTGLQGKLATCTATVGNTLITGTVFFTPMS